MSQLTDLSTDDINNLLNLIVDMENLYISISRQEDIDIKKVYIYLSRFLRHCILTRSPVPAILSPLGSPPFEELSIQKIISNFVFLKYGHLRETSKAEFQIYTELAKNILVNFPLYIYTYNSSHILLSSAVALLQYMGL